MDGKFIDFDPEFVESPEAREERLRSIRMGCPVARSEAHGGFWLISRHADVKAIANDPASFLSGKTIDPITGKMVGGTILPVAPMRFIPSETDGAEWERYRGALNAYFAPRAVENRRALASSHATDLIERFLDRGHLDLVEDLGNPLSTIATMSLLGLPLDDWQRWARPFHETVYWPVDSPEMERATRDLEWVFEQIKAEIALRRHTPKEDLLSKLMADPLDGNPFTDTEMLDLSIQVLGGAIETTTALTVNALIHLDSDDGLRARLIADRKLLRKAFDEYLRYFTPVQNMARTVAVETEIEGQRLCPGDRILMSFASANRDDTVFERPDEVIIDRSPNRHLGMGQGIHFCLGVHQARMMFEVMMNAVFDLIPNYKVIKENAYRYPSVGKVNGWIKVPVRF